MIHVNVLLTENKIFVLECFKGIRELCWYSLWQETWGVLYWIWWKVKSFLLISYYGDIGLPESKCVFINFSFGAKHVTPRSLSAHFIGNMVCVEGIVTKCKSSFVKFYSGMEYGILHILYQFLDAAKLVLDRKYTPPIEGFFVWSPHPLEILA